MILYKLILRVPISCVSKSSGDGGSRGFSNGGGGGTGGWSSNGSNGCNGNNGNRCGRVGGGNGRGRGGVGGGEGKFAITIITMWWSSQLIALVVTIVCEVNVIVTTMVLVRSNSDW